MSKPTDGLTQATIGPSSQAQAAQAQAAQPCFISALTSALPSGVLGWFFGFLPSVLRNRSLKLWKTWLDDGSKSGQNLMVFSGSYALANCIISRIRKVDDAFNRGFAGCATGLAVGWSGGPASAAQSCFGIGLISYLVDFGGASEQPAKANTCCGVSLGTSAASKNANPTHRPRAVPSQLSRAQHRLPPVMWLGAVCNAGNAYLDAQPWDAMQSRAGSHL